MFEGLLVPRLIAHRLVIGLLVLLWTRLLVELGLDVALLLGRSGQVGLEVALGLLDEVGLRLVVGHLDRVHGLRLGDLGVHLVGIWTDLLLVLRR